MRLRLLLRLATKRRDDEVRAGEDPRAFRGDRARVARLIPEATTDRIGWATDLYAAIAALELPATPDNICAAIAVIQQESGFRAVSYTHLTLPTSDLV